MGRVSTGRCAGRPDTATPGASMLEQLLMQYLKIISDELTQYQPQFTPYTQLNSYAAFMDNGSAVGGASTEEPQSINDVIYNIGNKMVYYSGS